MGQQRSSSTARAIFSVNCTSPSSLLGDGDGDGMPFLLSFPSPFLSRAKRTVCPSGLRVRVYGAVKCLALLPPAPVADTSRESTQHQISLMVARAEPRRSELGTKESEIASRTPRDRRDDDNDVLTDRTPFCSFSSLRVPTHVVLVSSPVTTSGPSSRSE